METAHSMYHVRVYMDPSRVETRRPRAED
uniref:Uncharacterized protein n=1 Tax=Zea mays TaxID=4577 RepID=C4J8C8_MAIZE|nr:unknown [Zea mays]